MTGASCTAGTNLKMQHTWTACTLQQMFQSGLNMTQVCEDEDEAQQPQLSVGGNPDVRQLEEAAAQEHAEGQQPQEEDSQEPAAARSEEEEVKNGSGGDGEDEGLDPAAVQAFTAAFQELRKWVDTSEAQYGILHANYEAAQERPALAIK